MKNRNRRLSRFLLPAAALALAGCVRAVPPPPVVGDDPALRRTLTQTLARRYPPQYRLVQRLALRAGGKQHDLIGYLVVAAGDSFRAVALGEMGGRIFDLSLESGRGSILKKPEAMPPSPLLTGAVEDIRHLFLPPPDAVPAAAATAAGSPTLTVTAADGRSVIYRFDPQDRRLTSSLETSAGKVVREARYADYRVLKNVDFPVPTHILLENRRWRYTLEIQVTEILPGPAAVTPGRD